MNKQKFIPLPLSVIEKIEKASEVFYLKNHDKWLKIQEIGQEAIKRKPITLNGKTCYQVTKAEFDFLNQLYKEATEII